MFNRPYSTTLHAFIFFFGIIVIQWGLASICLFKIWIFKKIPVIGERLTTRQERVKNQIQCIMHFMLFAVNVSLIEEMRCCFQETTSLQLLFQGHRIRQEAKINCRF